jgi:hypothetical protein
MSTRTSTQPSWISMCWSRVLLLATAACLVLGALAGPAFAASAPEEPVTEAATLITSTSATLNATINPHSKAVTGYEFDYSPNGVCVGLTSEPAAEETRGEADKVFTRVENLEPDREYTFCAVALHTPAGEPTETTSGQPLTLKTSPAKPTITEETATVTPFEAGVSALVNPNNQETKYQFKIGTSTTYTLATIPLVAGVLPAVFEGIPVTADLTTEGVPLVANAQYHYEATATNATGTTEGGDATFVTPPVPPVAETGEAADVTTTAATLTGSIIPSNSGFPAQDDTTYIFQYGPTDGYGEQTTAVKAGEGMSSVPVSATITGLEPARTYHYRIVAVNYNNTSTPQVVYGEDHELTTQPAQPSLTNIATSTGESQATVAATLDPQGLPARYELQLATTPGGTETQTAANTPGSETVPITLTVTSLAPNTLYYYRLTATNHSGSTQVEGTLKTSAAAATSVLLTQPATPQLLGMPAIQFPATTTALTKPKALTSKQKLEKALKTCHKQKNKHKRQACEKRARRNNKK